VNEDVSVFWAALSYVIYLYLALILARVVLEATRQFARSWRPAGATAIGIELVYIATDPPVKLLRRLIPPVRLGGVSLDLSIMVLLLAILVLYYVVSAQA
jgi:YggT family protein